VFTGDLVNIEAKEMDPWIEVFSTIKAPFGVYCILGNHDYGFYKKWKAQKELNHNMNHLFKLQKKMGWKLLRNKSIILQKGNEKIALIGVENWSAKGNYPNYGNLTKATKNIENIPFQILLSHDPSHWRAEVLQKYPHIDITLSGHTHGGQFAVENPLFSWSPIQYVYPEWKGLYAEGKQKLYVNVGFGFLGYPGRVGVLPEITCFELQRGM
ncbi:MAG: metallophosphoesterase, partial [Chitinophagaceae bacterium]